MHGSGPAAPGGLPPLSLSLSLSLASLLQAPKHNTALEFTGIAQAQEVQETTTAPARMRSGVCRSPPNSKRSHGEDMTKRVVPLRQVRTLDLQVRSARTQNKKGYTPSSISFDPHLTTARAKASSPIPYSPATAVASLVLAFIWLWVQLLGPWPHFGASLATIWPF